MTVTETTQGEVQTAPNKYTAFDVRQQDVRDDGQVKALIRSFKRLDHVVIWVGIIRRNEEHQPEVFADVVDINLTGTMRVFAAPRGLLKTSKGTIVNMASILSVLARDSRMRTLAARQKIGKMVSDPPNACAEKLGDMRTAKLTSESGL